MLESTFFQFRLILTYRLGVGGGVVGVGVVGYVGGIENEGN